MNEDLFEVQRLSVQFQLWSHAVAYDLEDDRLRVLFNAAHECVLIGARHLRVCPNIQILKENTLNILDIRNIQILKYNTINIYAKIARNQAHPMRMPKQHD